MELFTLYRGHLHFDDSIFFANSENMVILGDKLFIILHTIENRKSSICKYRIALPELKSPKNIKISSHNLFLRVDAFFLL